MYRCTYHIATLTGSPGKDEDDRGAVGATAPLEVILRVRELTGDGVRGGETGECEDSRELHGGEWTVKTGVMAEKVVAGESVPLSGREMRLKLDRFGITAWAA